MSAVQFVLKVHSRCDLACDHCYVYESADQSWRGRPVAVAPDIVAQTAMRIAEHVKTHDLASVEVMLHGGEPLLAGDVGIHQPHGAQWFVVMAKAGSVRDKKAFRTPSSRTGPGFTRHATDEAHSAAGPSRVAGSYLSGA
jgi:hypothetical protein